MPAEAVEDLMSFGFMPAPPEMLEPVPSAVHPEEVMLEPRIVRRGRPPKSYEQF